MANIVFLLIELYDTIKWVLCVDFISVLVMPSKEKDCRKAWTGFKVQPKLHVSAACLGLSHSFRLCFHFITSVPLLFISAFRKNGTVSIRYFAAFIFYIFLADFCVYIQ